MEILDDDVLENILFRLPLGTFAKLVCRSWKTILDDKRRKEVEGFLLAFHGYEDNRINKLYFGEEYNHIDIGNKMMKNYYFNYETLMELEHCRFSLKSFQIDILVGSCNGLVCFQKKDSGIDNMPEPFTVCNPLTGEFIFLKPNLSRASEEVLQVSSGFGYCQSTNEYKVVSLYNLKGVKPRRLHAQVYTIGSNKWRDLESCIDHTFDFPGIFANGVLHWLDYNHMQIIVFDLELEEFAEFPLPPSEGICGGDWVYNVLKLLSGNLCWVVEPTDNIDIWVYKRNNHNTNNSRNGTEEHDHKHNYYNGNSWKWVKEFSINRNYLEPLAILKSNQVLLLGGNTYVFCFDPKTQTVREVGYVMGDGSYIEAIPHANSYVSLKDFRETWYGPGCSAVPQINSSVLLTESEDAHLRRKRKRQPLTRT